MAKKKALGRGLDHLFEQNHLEEEIKKGNLEVINLAISDIVKNPYQPRKIFDDEKLKELSESIKANGVFQPILVNKGIVNYQIIAGERRFRASQLAGLETIPAIVYEYTDEQMMEVALIENIQREDLNVVEEAKSYAMIIDNLGISKTELATKIGKSRPHISNLLRLLNLSDYILEEMQIKKITMGQVKPLITIEDKNLQKEIFNRIVKEELTARQVEKIVKEKLNPKVEKIVEKTEKKEESTRNKRLEKTIRERVGFKVLVNGNDKGNIEIKFNSNEELEHILETLNLI